MGLVLVFGGGCYFAEPSDVRPLTLQEERAIGPLNAGLAFVPYGVAANALGDIYVVGEVDGELDLPVLVEPLTGSSHGSRGAVVLSFDASLEYRWGVRFQSATGEDVAHDVAVDDAGDVVVGAAAGDAFVAKLSGTSGTPRWVEVFSDGPADSALVAVEIAPDQDIIAAGYHAGMIAFDRQQLPSTDRQVPMVVRLGQDGRARWTKHFLTSGPAHEFVDIRDLAVTAGGSIAFAGGKTSDAAVDFGDGVTLPEGEIFVLGLLRADGSTSWVRGHSTTTARGVSVSPDDRLEVVGTDRGDAPARDTRYWRYDLEGAIECEAVEDLRSSFDTGRAIASSADATFLASDVSGSADAAALTRIGPDCEPHLEASVDNVAAGLAHDLAFDDARLLYSSTTQVWDLG